MKALISVCIPRDRAEELSNWRNSIWSCSRKQRLRKRLGYNARLDYAMFSVDEKGFLEISGYEGLKNKAYIYVHTCNGHFYDEELDEEEIVEMLFPDKEE